MPMIGRKVHDIWKVTKVKIITQMPMCFEPLWLKEVTVLRIRRVAKTRQTDHMISRSVPTRAVASVDCAKIQNTGANPIRRIPISAEEPAIRTAVVTNEMRDPLRHEKI